MNRWTDSAEQIEARRRQARQDFIDFPGEGLGDGLTEALTTPGHQALLLDDYREVMQQCDEAAAQLQAKQAAKPKRFSLLAFLGVTS
jgi:hypothetical protein